MENIFFETMKNCTDEEFLELLCRAEQEPIINGVKMPGFPDPEFQKNTVGSSGSATLRGEGRIFYKLVKEYAANLGHTIRPDTRILDFGCGWGRMIRFYFKDIKSENIFGIDVWPDMVTICKSTLHYGNFFTVTPVPSPKTHFSDNSFDIIFAYSVFSHLRHDAAEKWINEFSRILKLGGILVATTQGEGFLDYCKQYKDDPGQITSSWHRTIAKCFDPIEEYRIRYRNGEFLYAATGGGATMDASFYGEAVIPKENIERHFGKYLNFTDFFYDTNRLPQACFVMQKSM